MSADQDRTIARTGSVEQRRKLARRKDLQPELLYFLAEDANAEVRQEVAGNESTPWQADALLVVDKDVDVRSGLGPKLARLLPGLSDAARASVRDRVLKMIQQLEPAGVGARDHREMLLLQVHDSMPFHDVVETLIRDHLEDIALNRLPLIQRSTGFSLELIKIGIEQIQTLNPYPGRGFEQRPVQRVTPDLIVEPDDHGRYVVRVLDEYIPELRISPRYLKMLKDNPSQETKDWIRRKVESAKWLIDSIEQRYATQWNR